MSFAFEEFSLLEFSSPDRVLNLAEEFWVVYRTAHKQLLDPVQLFVADVTQCLVVKCCFHGAVHFILQEEGLYVIGVLVQVPADEVIGPLRRVNNRSNSYTYKFFTSYSFCSHDFRASFNKFSSLISTSCTRLARIESEEWILPRTLLVDFWSEFCGTTHRVLTISRVLLLLIGCYELILSTIV